MAYKTTLILLQKSFDKVRRCETIEVDTLFKVKVISLIFDYLADTGIA
jgi:hypothetical protein